MGAGGRDFHDFNVVLRDDPDVTVVAFTAAQIPGIDDRTYPATYAGPRYPDGIPIVPEEQLAELIARERVDEVVFAYSDVPYEYVMHRSAQANALGADFRLLGPDKTMIRSSKPVIAVCAVRTGSGKSQTSRKIQTMLRAAGKRDPLSDAVATTPRTSASSASGRFPRLLRHRCVETDGRGARGEERPPRRRDRRLRGVDHARRSPSARGHRRRRSSGRRQQRPVPALYSCSWPWWSIRSERRRAYYPARRTARPSVDQARQRWDLEQIELVRRDVELLNPDVLPGGRSPLSSSVDGPPLRGRPPGARGRGWPCHARRGVRSRHAQPWCRRSVPSTPPVRGRVDRRDLRALPISPRCCPPWATLPSSFATSSNDYAAVDCEAVIAGTLIDLDA